MQITDQCVVLFHYMLTDDEGNVIDASHTRGALGYLHGSGQIVPGLEKAMEGRSAGDQFKVALPPEEGYGKRDESLVQTVPAEAFKGIDEIKPGMQFTGQGAQGPLEVTVTKVADGMVTVDANHLLAGKSLHFDIKIEEVRAATEEELQHGHVHGEGGHQH
jgi:FKBP-type peptidyl-prolyl cis-trans isomerase SlyD